MPNMKSSGFTLVELLVVMAVIGVLASTILVNIDKSRALARDATRLADIRQIEQALYMHRNDTGTFPAVASSGDPGPGGWRVSYLNNFLAPLSGYLTEVPLDPINSGPPSSLFNPRPDGSFYYSYYYYPNGSTYGCEFSGPFAVLTIRSFEAGSKTDIKQAKCGPAGFTCPDGGIPNVCRDWSTEFDYSVIVVQ